MHVALIEVPSGGEVHGENGCRRPDADLRLGRARARGVNATKKMEIVRQTLISVFEPDRDRAGRRGKRAFVESDVLGGQYQHRGTTTGGRRGRGRSRHGLDGRELRWRGEVTICSPALPGTTAPAAT